MHTIMDRCKEKSGLSREEANEILSWIVDNEKTAGYTQPAILQEKIERNNFKG